MPELNTWEATALYCQETFGSYVNWEEQFFICPECQEPIYYCDWACMLAGRCVPSVRLIGRILSNGILAIL